MTIEERKANTYEQLAQLEKEIEILKSNIAEFRDILDKIHTAEDAKKYEDFDIEKGLEIINLM